MRRYALILTHNRPEELRDVVDAIEPQVDEILVIDNASEPPTHQDDGLLRPRLTIMRDMEQPPNLSRLWNQGFAWIQVRHTRTSKEPIAHNIAVLTDDVLIPQGWFAAVSEAMDEYSCAAGCSNPFPRASSPVVKRAPDNSIIERMFGPAFIIRGELGLRADEDLRWWWGDTDLDWKARQAGGMVSIPGFPVVNRYPNHSTVGELAEQAGRDGETFARKWGWRPW